MYIWDLYGNTLSFIEDPALLSPWTLHPTLNLLFSHVSDSSLIVIINRFGKIVRRIHLQDYFPELTGSVFIEKMVVKEHFLHFTVCGWGKLGSLHFKQLEEFTALVDLDGELPTSDKNCNDLAGRGFI